MPSDLGAYYTWFLKAVAKWLDIALFKAVQRILKAVELDDLSKPVDEMVRNPKLIIQVYALVSGEYSIIY